jgi:iron complex outermembrane receptor protein
MPRKVESYYTVDLTGSYAITPRLRVGAAILNALDQQPPFDPGVSTTYFIDRTLYNVVGRTFRVGLRYTFE